MSYGRVAIRPHVQIVDRDIAAMPFDTRSRVALEARGLVAAT